MRPQIRLRLGLVLRSQRAFPLIVILLIAPAVTIPAGGAISDDYVLTGILALPVAAWMTIALVSIGHASLAQAIVTAARGRWRIATGSVLIAVTFALGAAFALSVAPLVLGGRGSRADWRDGWLCLTACMGTAAACGLLASRLAGRHPAAAFLVGLVTLAVAASVPGIGPVRVAFDAQSGAQPSPATLVVAAVSALLLVPVAGALAMLPGDIEG